MFSFFLFLGSWGMADVFIIWFYFSFMEGTVVIKKSQNEACKFIEGKAGVQEHFGSLMSIP